MICSSLESFGGISFATRWSALVKASIAMRYFCFAEIMVWFSWSAVPNGYKFGAAGLHPDVATADQDGEGLIF